MAWHKGTWWPLYVKEWYGPRCSQHMFDPYSFCLLVLGLFLHLLWGTDNIGNWVFGFVAAVLVELVWELIGNSTFILKRIKNNSGTSGEYNGLELKHSAVYRNKKKYLLQVTPFRIFWATFSPAPLVTSLAQSSLRSSCGGSASSGLSSLR